MSEKETIKKTIDELKETALKLNEKLLIAEERYKASEQTLQKIKNTASTEIQTAYRNGYNKALIDIQASSGGFTVTGENTNSINNDNTKKLVLKSD